MKKTLRDYRKERGMTALGVTRATGGLIGEMRVYAIERGRYPAKPEERAALAAVLGVPEQKLFSAKGGG